MHADTFKHMVQTQLYAHKQTHTHAIKVTAVVMMEHSEDRK